MGSEPSDVQYPRPASCPPPPADEASAAGTWRSPGAAVLPAHTHTPSNCHCHNGYETWSRSISMPQTGTTATGGKECILVSSKTPGRHPILVNFTDRLQFACTCMISSEMLSEEVTVLITPTYIQSRKIVYESWQPSLWHSLTYNLEKITKSHEFG